MMLIYLMIQQNEGKPLPADCFIELYAACFFGERNIGASIHRNNRFLPPLSNMHGDA